MIWFFLFQLLGFVFTVGCWYLYGKVKRDKTVEDEWYDVVIDNIKKFFVSVVIVFTILTVVMIKPLYYTAQCSFNGVSMNANTKYSWYMGTCLVETKDGSWIPLRITRGVPNGAEHHDSSSLDNSTY